MLNDVMIVHNEL